MSRTEIQERLIHDLERLKQNSQLFDKLCEEFKSVFQSIFEFRKKAELKQGLQTDDESSVEFKEELNVYLRGAVSFTTSCWINVLDGAYRANCFNLTEYLLPQNHEYGRLFFHLLEDNYVITEAETCRLMEQLRDKLFENTSRLLLPISLCIIKTPGGFDLESR